jgi:hypothetical protein
MSNIIAFVDNVGRVIVGDHVGTIDGVMKVKEPAVVNVQVNQENGQISVQLLPFIFREFVKEKSREDGVVWNFNVNNTVTSDNIELDDPIIQQYKNIFNKPVAAPERSEPEVVKLFDE